MVQLHEDGTAEFAYYRPSASTVMLAGDFNLWDAKRLEMTRDEHGWWRTRLALPPGEYRFKYVIDEGVWEADFAAYGVEMSKVGGWTSVLMIPRASAEAGEALAA